MSYRQNKVSKFNYYSTVKKTYEEHLIESLKEAFYKKIRDICDKLKEKNKNSTKILKSFQAEMSNVRKWEYDELKSAAKFVINKSKINYIPKLIRAVVISNIKLLTATASRKKIEIEKTTPEPIAFFHRCFIEISKAFFADPYLVCDYNDQPGLRLKNIKESIFIIEGCIKKSINSFLPYDNILDVYLIQAEEDSDEEEEPIQDEESEDEETEDEETEDEETEDESSIQDEDNDEDIQSIASEKSEHLNDDIQSIHSDSQKGGGELDLSNDPDIVSNNFDDDETMSISDDLPDELNLIPMVDEEPKIEQHIPKSQQQAQDEVKTIKVKQVTPNDIIKQDSGMVFFDDADDI
jgi:hypothetical protein